MTALLLWGSLAWGQAPDEHAVARQQARVAELAGVVADARDSNAPRSEVAAAMRAYRSEAEVLADMEAAMQRAEGDAMRAARERALLALAEALAAGRPDPDARALLADWLGDLDALLGTLRQALSEAGSRPADPLSHALALDIAEKAQVVWLVASYDEYRARSDARELALRAHALRSRSASGMSGGFDDVLEARALEEEAERRLEAASLHQARVEQAASLHLAALAFGGETP